MTDQEFLDVAEQLLRNIETTCDRINEATDADLDNQRVGNMVTLTFVNRSQIVINLQKPLHEVWMASPTGGYHYRYVEGVWQDTKGETDFYTALSRDASQLAGQAIHFQSA
jgi:CyaY protein